MNFYQKENVKIEKAIQYSTIVLPQSGSVVLIVVFTSSAASANNDPSSEDDDDDSPIESLSEERS
jgi:hypothetical protein